MATKLTLYIDDDLVHNAKEYAKERGLSLSKVVNDFFRLLQRDDEHHTSHSAPLSSSLKGIIKSSETDEDKYKNYLEEKYR